MGYSTRSATPHLCWQAIGRWSYTFRLQYPEGVDLAFSLTASRWMWMLEVYLLCMRRLRRTYLSKDGNLLNCFLFFSTCRARVDYNIPQCSCAYDFYYHKLLLAALYRSLPRPDEAIVIISILKK